MENKFIEQIKSFRVTIDGLSKRAYFTRQIVSEELKMSKAWLGMIFSVCGLESPYYTANVPSEIPSTTDVNNDAIENIEFNNHEQYLDAINRLRESIDSLFEQMQMFEVEFLKAYTNKVEDCYKQSWVHLVNAKMHLGFELSRLSTIYKIK